MGNPKEIFPKFYSIFNFFWGGGICRAEMKNKNCTLIVCYCQWREVSIPPISPTRVGIPFPPEHLIVNLSSINSYGFGNKAIQQEAKVSPCENPEVEGYTALARPWARLPHHRTTERRIVNLPNIDLVHDLFSKPSK